MWIAFSLTAAVGAAATSLVLKQTVSHGGVVVSTVAFRIVAGILLVTAGIYCVGLQPGESALEPLRALRGLLVTAGASMIALFG